MAARRKEHQPDKSAAVGERNINTDHGINVSGKTEAHFTWTTS
jgi:hypothetical protein